VTQSNKIHTGDINDSEAIGIGENVTVTVNRTENNQITYENSEIEPIDLDPIQCYLRMVQQPQMPSIELEAMRRFYSIAFHVHLPGEINIERENIWHSVRKFFARQRQAEQPQKLVILAEAGMGKTPALEYIQRWQAEATLETHYYERQELNEGSNEYTFVIPFLIELADLLYDDFDFVDLVCNAFNRYLNDPEFDQADYCLHQSDTSSKLEPINRAQATWLIHHHTCLFLLDELDVLIANNNERAIQMLRHFIDHHGQDQFVVTCRTANYGRHLGTVDVLMLDDLNEEELKIIMGGARYKNLNRTLRQLARNRSLLEIILKLEKDAIHLVSKGQLFAKLNSQDWVERGKDTLAIDVDMAEDLLEQLAYAMAVDRVQRYDELQVMRVVKQYLQEWDEPYSWRKVVTELRRIGILHRDTERHWKFTSRTKAAYFAAAAIAQRPDERLKPILSHINDPALLEMLELLMGLLRNPSDLFQLLLEKKYVLLAAHCLQFTCNPLDETINEQLTQALIERIDSEHTEDRRSLILQLGESGHEQALETLLRTLREERSSIVVLNIVRAIWVCIDKNSTIDWEAIDTRVTESLSRNNTKAMQLADLLPIYKSALTGPAEEREKNVLELIDRLQKESHPLRRGLIAIGLGFIGSYEACEALLDVFCQQNVDSFVGWCSTEALAQIQHDDIQEQVLALCSEEPYQKAGWDEHRARAFYLLGWVGQQSQKQRVEINKLLIDALDDPDIWVKGFAIQSIGRLGLRVARPRIEQMLSRENDAWLRRKMAQTLGKIGTRESIDMLKEEKRLEMARTRTLRSAIREIMQREPVDS